MKNKALKLLNTVLNILYFIGIGAVCIAVLLIILFIFRPDFYGGHSLEEKRTKMASRKLNELQAIMEHYRSMYKKYPDSIYELGKEYDIGLLCKGKICEDTYYRYMIINVSTSPMNFRIRARAIDHDKVEPRAAIMEIERGAEVRFVEAK